MHEKVIKKMTSLWMVASKEQIFGYRSESQRSVNITILDITPYLSVIAVHKTTDSGGTF